MAWRVGVFEDDVLEDVACEYPNATTRDHAL